MRKPVCGSGSCVLVLGKELRAGGIDVVGVRVVFPEEVGMLEPVGEREVVFEVGSNVVGIWFRVGDSVPLVVEGTVGDSVSFFVEGALGDNVPLRIVGATVGDSVPLVVEGAVGDSVSFFVEGALGDNVPLRIVGATVGDSVPLLVEGIVGDSVPLRIVGATVGALVFSPPGKIIWLVQYRSSNAPPSSALR